MKFELRLSIQNSKLIIQNSQKVRFKMKRSIHARSFASLLVIFCLLIAPLTVFAKKGDKNFREGMKYETAQQWEKAAQEFTLAVAADPSNVEYQLHYRRAVFNASQSYMQQGRALAEQRDYLGAYNAFRQAYGYDPVNQLALSEMERMMRLQREKTGESDNGNGANGAKVSTTSFNDTTSAQQGTGATPAQPSTTAGSQQDSIQPTRPDKLQVIKYTGDLKYEIRNLAEQLGLNVIFDTQTFRTPRSVEINLTDVTTAQALDLIFLQEGLFFQKINRHTILVADQNRRVQYQQLAIKTFYLANSKPDEAMKIIQAMLPPNQGRPQPVMQFDKDTNSISVRDTPENLRMIGELLQSIDKDRAEVVMDIGIYEVSRTDLLQFGNQFGTGDSSGFFSLGSSSPLSIVGGSRQVASAVAAAPTALGAAFVIPASQLTAFQNRNHTRLLASTQIHAFNNEESSARIGQRVPVQTAQTYPFSTVPTTGTTGATTTPGVFSGGFPVIQYEPTGLTLKFTPQVFPNLDVQVKMDIESKDVQGAGSLTPTFTERTITGTARIQNNRTMMIASVSQDSQSNGRRGLPVLGLMPVLGRLFTSPTRNDNQIDIVIAVTPRVLRAPAVTPNDEKERYTGTMQSPPNSSLEAMVNENYREDQLAAAAHKIPTNAVVQLADAEPPPAYVPAPNILMPKSDNATTQSASAKSETTTPAALVTPAPLVNSSQSSNVLANAIAQLTGEPPPLQTALLDKSSAAAPRTIAASQPTSVPATTPAVTQPAATTTTQPAATVQPAKVEAAPDTSSRNPAVSAKSSDSSKNQSRAEKPSLTEKLKVGLFGKPPGKSSAPPATTSAEARLVAEQQEMKVGGKQRIALVLSSNEPLGNAILRLHFDPKVIAVRGVSPGVWTDSAEMKPSVMQSIDPAGIVAVAVSPQMGAPLKIGSNVVLFLEVEALTPGESVISFDPLNLNIVTWEGRVVQAQLAESRLTVK
jgi:general secretion pathway protein D